MCISFFIHIAHVAKIQNDVHQPIDNNDDVEFGRYWYGNDCSGVLDCGHYVNVDIGVLDCGHYVNVDSDVECWHYVNVDSDVDCGHYVNVDSDVECGHYVKMTIHVEHNQTCFQQYNVWTLY